MRQYTTPEQTAQLIELGFPKPKFEIETQMCNVKGQPLRVATIVGDYSIGELIEMLPSLVEYRGFYYGLQITTDCTYCWDVRYEPCPYEKGKPKLLPIHDSGSCLIDILYNVLINLVALKDELTDTGGHDEYNQGEVLSEVFKLKAEEVI